MQAGNKKLMSGCQEGEPTENDTVFLTPGAAPLLVALAPVFRRSAIAASASARAAATAASCSMSSSDCATMHVPASTWCDARHTQACIRVSC